MSLTGLFEWGGRGGHKQVYVYRDEHRNRIGDCKFKPIDGDLCIRFADAGDNFHDYIAVRKNESGKFIKAGEFGAYEFARPALKLDDRTYYLALAGEPIELNI